MKKGKELGSFFTHKPMNTRIHTSLYEPRFAHTQQTCAFAPESHRYVRLFTFVQIIFACQASGVKNTI